MSIIFKEWITRQDVQDNPDKIFVFGDNDGRGGNGGQAKEMRGEPNSLGIRVKRYAGTDKTAYYYDTSYEENIEKISDDFLRLESLLKGGKDAIIPSKGIGTGLARLKEFAPRTLRFVDKRITELCKKYGVKKEN